MTEKLTNMDFILIFQKYLRQSVLMKDPKKPNGIVSTARLDNSEKEDVIISPIFLTLGQIQEGYINVNIFVRNLHLKIGEVWDDSQQDTERLSYLEKLAIKALNQFDETPGFSDGYSVTIQQIIPFDEGIFTKLNIRTEVTAVTA